MMSHKRARSPSPQRTTQIFRSSSIEDRSSRFVAVFSPTFSAESLQALPDFNNASHRMTAWRLLSKQRSLNSQLIFETGHDDDGENHGGKNLEKVLIAKRVSGTVMVARWYGGVMLGPVRFDHIRNCASDAIGQWAREGEHAAKRAKTETDRLRRVEILSERDQSIAVLRGLLAEKKQGVASSPDNTRISPVKAPDYAKMEIPLLERLEQVRDKTIGWILAQIEQAEKAQENISNRQSLRAGEVEVEQKEPPNTAGEKSSKRENVHKVLTGSETPAK